MIKHLNHQYRLTLAQTTDLSVIVELRARCFSPASGAQILDYVDTHPSTKHYVLTADNNPTPIGCVTLAQQQTPDDAYIADFEQGKLASDCVRIKALCITSIHRNQGYARFMIESLEQYLQGSVIWFVAPYCFRLLALKLGYSPTGNPFICGRTGVSLLAKKRLASD